MSNTMTTSNSAATQAAGVQSHRPAAFSPRFDIWEGENEYILYGDLPGVAADSLDIHYENRQLTIHGKVDRRNTSQSDLLCEYGVGDFERVFSLGEAINQDAISAELKDGVLTLHLPKPEEAKPRRIEVKGM